MSLGITPPTGSDRPELDVSRQLVQSFHDQQKRIVDQVRRIIIGQE
jgi:hypothetical protein